MLELNGGYCFPEMGKASGPAKAELLLPGIFLPPRQLLDVLYCLVPEIRREIFDHAMDGFCGRRDIPPGGFPGMVFPVCS